MKSIKDAIPLLKGLKNFSIYTLISVAQKAGTFLLLPVYTYWLAPEDLGIISFSIALAAVLPPLLMLNTSEYVYFIALKRGDGWKRELASMFGFQAIATVGAYGVIGAIYLAMRGDNPSLWGIPVFPFLAGTLCFSASSVLFNSYSLVAQALEKVRRFTYLNISFSVCSIALILLFLTVMEMKALSFVLANLILYTAYGVIIIFLVRKEFGLAFRRKDVEAGLRYSAPLTPHILSHWGKGYLDRIFLASFVSTAALGLFHFAATLASVVQLASDAFVKVNNPRFFSDFPDPVKRDRLVAVLHSAAVVFSVGGVLMSFHAREILWFFDAAYQESFILLPYLVSGNLVYLAYLGIVNTLFIGKRTLLVSALTFSSGALSAIASYLLISRFALAGAVWSYFASNLLIGIAVFWGAQAVDRTRWKFLQLLMILSAPMLGLAVNHWIPAETALKALFSLGVSAVLLWMARAELTQVLANKKRNEGHTL